MTEIKNLTMTELEAGLAEIRQAPKDEGVLQLICRRPRTDEREVLPAGELDPAEGLVGDNWKTRGDGPANPDVQLTVMNARAIDLITAGDKNRWPLAGDQLFVDLDLSGENLSPGARLTIGGAVIEVTAVPHTGCQKFVSRFGPDAMKFVNSPTGRALNLRGINAKVIQAGQIRVGDLVKKI